MHLSLSVNYPRQKLIAVVKLNRKMHASQFNQNVKMYRAKQREWLQDQLEKIEKPKAVIQRQMNFPAPKHYIQNYDRALSMLEACADENICLDHTTYSTLVMDDWDGQGINQYPLAINTPLDSSGYYGPGEDGVIDLLDEN